jgi:thymidine kinase
MLRSNPEFIVFAGAMFSSKTSKLLMTMERYKYQKKQIVVFKPKIDTRYSDNAVVSHSGWTTPAVVVENGAQVLEHLLDGSPPDVVVVDEMFMIEGIGDVLIWLYRNMGLTIVVSTLDISATGKSFAEVEKVLSWATRVEKCSAVCTVCGADAYYTYKKAPDSKEIHVGGSELYEPRCFCHHFMVNKQTEEN